jgi:hypothetical protein
MPVWLHPHLRREVAAGIGPKLKRIQLQLDNIGTELNLAITTRPRQADHLVPQAPAHPLPCCRFIGEGL